MATIEVEGVTYDTEKDLTDVYGGHWRFKSPYGAERLMLAEVLPGGRLGGCMYTVTTIIETFGKLTPVDREEP